MFDRLEFNNNFFLDQKIEPVFADLVITIKKWDRFLPNERNSADGKLNCQRLFVDGLEKAWSKLAMHCDRGRNYLLGNTLIP